MPAPNTLGIDFGTSNSAAGIAVNGRPWLVELEPGHRTLPTAVFFEEQPRRMRIGGSAVQALVAGEEGRFMRALKSLLGTPLLREDRRINGERINFIEIIARFLREVKSRSEAATYQDFTHALSGRPVRFHSHDERRNAQAEIDLRDCYLAAGFEDVRFMLEPEAAARATTPEPGLGLIIDIGGGTSDFSVFRQDKGGATEVLASYGLRIGGTDFDRRLSLDYVMPLLGRGSDIRNAFGSGALPAPAKIFNDLATWQMIPFLYAADSRRMAHDLARNAVEPDKLARLVAVLENELGHDVAFAVERGKIQSNQPGHPAPRIDLKELQRGLDVPLSPNMLRDSLHSQITEITAGAAETLVLSGITGAQIERIELIGGSSLMAVIEQQMRQLCPQAQVHKANAMTAVADGLALASATAFA